MEPKIPLSELFGTVELDIPQPHGSSLCGLPVIVDASVRPDTIEFRDAQGRVSSRITGLSVSWRTWVHWWLIDRRTR